tara:strand:- start:6492 stop:6974 length:483 start_codon:yes stop_codon:yes gene_type:complete
MLNRFRVPPYNYKPKTDAEQKIYQTKLNAEFKEIRKKYKEKHSKEIVYIVARPTWKNIFKIGRTSFTIKRNDYFDALEHRIKSLNNTSLRESEFFKIKYAWVSNDYLTSEKYLHNYFNKYRETKNREFFLLKPLQIDKFLRKASKKDLKIICSPYFTEKK